VKTRATIRLRAFEIIADAVERGVQRGMTRAYKHTNDPNSEHIAECVDEAVMGELCEVLDFDADRDNSPA
jgi:hypothetical protein